MISPKNKPNSNPIQTQSKPISAQKRGYQSQTNPIQTQFCPKNQGGKPNYKRQTGLYTNREYDKTDKMGDLENFTFLAFLKSK
jgi:hypothetical protein